MFMLLALVTSWIVGCSSPELHACAVRCGTGDFCPAEMTCGSDGFCHNRAGDLCSDPGVPDGSVGDGPADGGFDRQIQPDGSRDVGPNWDAFFAADPPPRMCLQDGTIGAPPDPPSGTPECPDDKNREGCPCYIDRGQMAPCWPGLRRNRDRGICRDGVTICEPFDDVSGRWGPCEGFVLPTTTETPGPDACSCFSRGRWQLDNLGACLVTYTPEDVYFVSTFGDARCPTHLSVSPPPSPEPDQPFSTNRLTVDCAGQFELCLTIKAGSLGAPSPTEDCLIARVCTEDWYGEPNVTQELPPLPSWTSRNSSCARRFRDIGGYAEMSVVGLSVDCDEIDDGSGGAFVFNRVSYCPFHCSESPSLPECVGCRPDGSGEF